VIGLWHCLNQSPVSLFVTAIFGVVSTLTDADEAQEDRTCAIIAHSR